MVQSMLLFEIQSLSQRWDEKKYETLSNLQRRFLRNLLGAIRVNPKIGKGEAFGHKNDFNKELKELRIKIRAIHSVKNRKNISKDSKTNLENQFRNFLKLIDITYDTEKKISQVIDECFPPPKKREFQQIPFIDLFDAPYNTPAKITSLKQALFPLFVGKDLLWDKSRKPKNETANLFHYLDEQKVLAKTKFSMTERLIAFHKEFGLNLEEDQGPGVHMVTRSARIVVSNHPIREKFVQCLSNWLKKGSFSFPHGIPEK
jgi:hypothetical protein